MGEHFLHNLVEIFPILIAVFYLFHTRGYKLTKLRVISIAVLVCFVSLHVSPDRLTHAANSHLASHESVYPCCIPQISEIPKITVVPVSVFYIQTLTTAQLQENPFVVILSNDSRAPPNFS